MQLLDTSVLIVHDQVILPPGPVVLSAISEAELRFGISRTTAGERRIRTRRLARIEKTFDAPWLPFGSAEAKGYAHVAAIIAEQQGALARSKDAMIAGHAYALGAKLLTLNPKDFDLVSDEVEIVVPALR